ncbi:cobalt-precorrin-6A reductase [Paenirhodobacter sp. CAU 1674]|uniref:cobalt-precorrin-6A reductase n=1 Tax=Paenirhodobacter sp. CAU 1674 TaxID=3032596 RepID=UPI0023DB9E81|nr:cobalt-precorrin-6A reductase [Paenirhodobacter sp. CAU 1674]MDF2141953.1 cobalt-precorrin-6A reductase [Paenirhodobacter sp. CAU 1674]
MTRLLILGGTTEASQLARAVHAAGFDAVFSYAGRTAAPVAQPLPTRIGGFGGVPGLVDYLRAEAISHVIDATHPFAAGMSKNAISACIETKIPLLGLERPAWQAGSGDHWQHVPDLEAAITALPDLPARVFLAIGKQHLAPFAAKPQHHYLLRLVDPPEGALPLPDAQAVIARGPFTPEGDEALLRAHHITHIVAKNSGGTGAEAKLIAARRLGLPVILIDRPGLPPRKTVGSVTQVLDWLRHHGASAERGV